MQLQLIPVLGSLNVINIFLLQSFVSFPADRPLYERLIRRLCAYDHRSYLIQRIDKASFHIYIIPCKWAGPFCLWDVGTFAKKERSGLRSFPTGNWLFVFINRPGLPQNKAVKSKNIEGQRWKEMQKTIYTISV